MAANWRPVIGWESLYEVSDQGSVRSLTRVTPYRGTTRTFKGRELRQFSGGSYSYLQVKLSKIGRKETAYVHRLVLEAFSGPPPTGMEALHGPAGSTDNRLSNLSWGTHVQNCGPDEVRDGTDNRGSKHLSAKLTEAIVLNCRKRAEGPETLKSLAEEFGVTAATMRDAVTGRTWRHI